MSRWIIANYNEIADRELKKYTEEKRDINEFNHLDDIVNDVSLDVLKDYINMCISVGLGDKSNRNSFLVTDTALNRIKDDKVLLKNYIEYCIAKNPEGVYLPEYKYISEVNDPELRSKFKQYLNNEFNKSN